MRLFEHSDFDQAILRSAEYFRGQRFRPALIEKDYYVTEALRSKRVRLSAPKMRGRSRWTCCTSGAPSSKKCSSSTASPIILPFCRPISRAEMLAQP